MNEVSRDGAAYIEQIKRSITNYEHLGGGQSFEEFNSLKHYDEANGRWNIVREEQPLTLLFKSQLDLIEEVMLRLEGSKVPGDYIEAGIWRGGAIILMRALLDAHEIADRKIFAADSFEGIPPNKRFRHDPVDNWNDRWAASLDEVKQGIERYGLLDDRIAFVEGYFEDSLKTLADQRFALIRLDSDSYDSVETSLEYLYPLLSPGGIIIIDDWHLIPCKMAVGAYRGKHGIKDEIVKQADNAYWVKQQDYRTPPLPTI